jgi:hypothetical protein
MMNLFTAVLVVALQHPPMPAGMSHEEHLKQMAKEAELKKRGTRAMGFDQDKTAHHFRTSATGGSIEVEVTDPADSGSRDLVRSHLKEIAAEFAKGEFAKPFQTHAEVPPGVPTMERLKAAIRYKYEETPRGGMVRISTSNSEALEAIHEFLAYQAGEHHTGDRGSGIGDRGSGIGDRGSGIGDRGSGIGDQGSAIGVGDRGSGIGD